MEILEQFRKEQPELFDENGKQFKGVIVSPRQTELMLSVIDEMESVIKTYDNEYNRAVDEIARLEKIIMNETDYQHP